MVDMKILVENWLKTCIQMNISNRHLASLCSPPPPTLEKKYIFARPCERDRIDKHAYRKAKMRNAYRMKQRERYF